MSDTANIWQNWNNDKENGMVSISEITESWPEERRKRVEERAQEMIVEERTRQDLRKTRVKTQTHLAKELGVSLEEVCRMEEQADLLLSTLAGYVEAMGGQLRLVAEFPGRPPMVVNGINGIDEEFQLYEPRTPIPGPLDLDGDNPVKQG